MASLILSKITKEEYQCGWYFVAFVLDTSLGVFLAYLFLKLIERCAVKKNWSSLETSGNYIINKKINYFVWLKQLVSWAFIVICAKIICASILIGFYFVLKYPAIGLCNLFGNNAKTMLIFVMILGPGLLNLIQVWIQDNFLKKKEPLLNIDETNLINNEETFDV